MPPRKSGKNLKGMEIKEQEFNKKCTKFFEFTYIEHGLLEGQISIPEIPEQTFPFTPNYWMPEENRYICKPKFFTNWDWLMRVVEKIEDLYSGSFQVDILQEGCRITKYCKDIIAVCTVISNPECKTKKEAVIFCVDKFLDYYAEIKKLERNGI